MKSNLIILTLLVLAIIVFIYLFFKFIVGLILLCVIIGLGYKLMSNRNNNKTLMPYKFDILLEKQATPSIVFNTELLIKKTMNDKKYLSLLKFCGQNESFKDSVIDEIIELINKNIL